ncbi:PhzF family phenazine biosynthesis protein, partial [Oleiphilus sp. HI0086]|uniref:PhzF family phenazine biosynthesis protein n=1 Tax=Oleiphilus sp. HI0086 TaxID=1822260 RepID=UPI001E2958D0
MAALGFYHTVSDMKIKQYQVDAFATRAFEGNPAAVCPLDNWLKDELLQAIAEENNLSET